LHPQLAEAVFGEQVGRVHFPGDLAEINTTEADGLLDPQSVGVQVAKLTEALSVANTYGGAGVSPYA
jgi:hypothetical protein